MITKYIILAITLLSTYALATPTAEDFQQCHRMTAAALEECLNENPGSQNTTRCFKEASRVLSRCVAELKSSHSKERRKAAKSIQNSNTNGVIELPKTTRDP